MYTRSNNNGLFMVVRTRLFAGLSSVQRQSINCPTNDRCPSRLLLECTHVREDLAKDSLSSILGYVRLYHLKNPALGLKHMPICVCMPSELLLQYNNIIRKTTIPADSVKYTVFIRERHRDRLGINQSDQSQN